MKYVFKATGVIVESDRVLDSILFAPFEEKKTESNKKNTTSKRTVKKKSGDA